METVPERHNCRRVTGDRQWRKRGSRKDVIPFLCHKSILRRRGGRKEEGEVGEGGRGEGEGGRGKEKGGGTGRGGEGEKEEGREGEGDLVSKNRYR